MTEEHVILTAIVVGDKKNLGREHAEKFLHHQMPHPNDLGESYYIDSWWIAEDERYDGSDLGSAVFIPGDGCDPLRMTQEQASEVLKYADLIHRMGSSPVGLLRTISRALKEQ